MPTSVPANDQTTQVNTGGGSAIGHDVTIDKGDFVGRDKIEQHFHYHGASSSVSTSSQDALLFIPFPRKSATEFVGRDAELVELHEKLQQSQMVGVRPAAALTGLGGIGKTQLAVEYAYRYQASYPGGIFWLNAADLNRVRSALVETAERMELRADYNTTDNALLAGLVKRCQQQPATLLCFDNAPDAVILWRRLTQELNTATLGAAILITTRRRELPPNMAALDLRRLSDDTVRWLLEKSRPDLLTDPDLPRLLERLGGLPLVVSLVANALSNSPDATIADYLAALEQHGEEMVHEELDVHVADYDFYRGVYTRTLLPVLREQWERLCQQPKSGNAQLLLRIAGQLPEAVEIPIARLGLLAGLQDEKVIKPLTSAIQTLWNVALIEELKADAIRLHPLVRDFAEEWTLPKERAEFRIACAQRLADAYTNKQTGMRRLGSEYERQGIVGLLIDLITAINFCHTTDESDSQPFSFTKNKRDPHPSPLAALQSLLRLLRLESDKLQDTAQSWQSRRLWQQLLIRASQLGESIIVNRAIQLLSSVSHWRPQWIQQHQSLAIEQTLKGSVISVHTITVLDSQRIVSLSGHTLKVWNLMTGVVEQTLQGHVDIVYTVAVLDRQHIISASADKTLKVWNLATGVVEQTLKGHADTVFAIAVIDRQHIIFAADRTLKVWNLATGTVEQTLRGHADTVFAVAVIDHQRIISAAADKTLKVWNLKTGVVEQTLIGHIGRVNTVAILDPKRIVSASSDGAIKVWNLETGTVEQTLAGHEGLVSAVAVIDRQRIVSASHDRTLKIWNLQIDVGSSGRVEQTLRGHEAYVLAVAVVDHQHIISSSWDGAIKVWNLETSVSFSNRFEQTITEHTNRILALAVLDRQRIISAAADKTLKVWNLETGTLERTLTGHVDRVNTVAILDPQRIVSASSDGAIKVWNLETGTLEQTFRRHEFIVNDMATLDSQRIICAATDKTLKVWNLETGIVEQTFSGHEFSAYAVAVLGHQHIVSASLDYTLKVWNLETGAVEQTLRGHTECVNAVAVLDRQRIVSAAGRHIASNISGRDSTLKVWNLETGAIEQTLSGHKDSVRSIAVIDRQHIISASYDRTLKVWNLETGKEIASIELDGEPQCVAVAQQDGRTLVVAGDAGGALYCLELVEPVGRAH